MATCNKCGREVYPGNSLNYLRLFDMKTFTGTETYHDQYIDRLSIEEKEKIKLRLAALEQALHQHQTHIKLIEMLIEIGREEERHFLPENGWEGSPSLGQYIEGQERDLRPEYKYRLDYESRVRRAYAALQEWCKQKTDSPA